MNLSLKSHDNEKSSQDQLHYFTFEEWMGEELSHYEIDFEQTPPDQTIINKIGVTNCAKLGILPWQEISIGIVIFIDDMARAEAVREELSALQKRIIFAPIDRDDYLVQMHKFCGDDMLRLARNFCPENQSVRRLYRQNIVFMYGLLIALIAIVAHTIWAKSLGAILFMAMLLVVGNSFIRFLAVMHHIIKKPQKINTNIAPLMREHYPIISLLVPLYREPELLEQLVINLEKLDYPQEKLDIKLVLEADDEATLDALDNMRLPATFEVMRVPPCHLRTKPKAMNYTLPFCQGEIVGIYDAESRPAIHQLIDVAEAFHYADPDVATVQCELGFYNSHQNWFTRCFTIEYHIWFHILLPTMQRYSLPIPLGGTSVFFIKKHLETVRGWDAHNVTEDADLGVRFKRQGFKTIVLTSKTTEEANSHGISWIKQRSRWLKGYVLTWMSHMKNPISLYSDLGFRGTVMVQVLFLGAFGNYLAIPLFWILLLNKLGVDALGFGLLPIWLSTGFWISMVFAQAVSLGMGYIVLREKSMRGYILTWLTLPIYWLFGSAASYKALFELIFKPYYWDKTKHGLAKTLENNDANLAQLHEVSS